MGLKKESIFLLMQEGLRCPFQGRIITLGRQDVSATYDEILGVARKIGFPVRILETIELSDKPEMKAQKMISDRSLFKMLGFDELKSIDVSSYEKADVVYDLNSEAPPQGLYQSAQVVLDPGTIEHVFHVPNSLRNIFQMLQIGGRAIHIAPSSNHMDHGFYMFSPTLFSDYYRANHFDLQPIRIIRYKPQGVFPWKISSYEPGSLHPYSFGGLDDLMYAVYCIATKNTFSTFNKVPQQYHYEKNLWGKNTISISLSGLKNFMKKSSALYRGSLYFYRIYQKFRLKRGFKTLEL